MGVYSHRVGDAKSENSLRFTDQANILTAGNSHDSTHMLPYKCIHKHATTQCYHIHASTHMLPYINMTHWEAEESAQLQVMFSCSRTSLNKLQSGCIVSCIYVCVSQPWEAVTCLCSSVAEPRKVDFQFVPFVLMTRAMVVFSTLMVANFSGW